MNADVEQENLSDKIQSGPHDSSEQYVLQYIVPVGRVIVCVYRRVEVDELL